MRVAVTLEQCWHRIPGGVAIAAVESVAAQQDLGDDELIGVSARHARPPMPGLRPAVEVRQLALPRPALYASWHRFRRPEVERATGPVDLIHATGMAVPPRTAPLVVTVHDLAFLENPGHSTPRGLRFFRRAVELAREEADIVVCPSQVTIDECVSHGFDPDRLRLVPWGVAPSTVGASEVAAVRGRFGLPDRFVLWVGTREPRKNLTTLLEAMVGLDDPAPLVLAGPPGWNEDITGLIAKLERNGRTVHTLGFVPTDDLAAVYRAATVFCLPSLAEGFGLPVLEAMAQGTPVITSRGTAAAEVAGDDGLLIDPRRVDEVRTALDEVLADPGLADALGHAGLLRSGRYSWRHTAEALHLAYLDAAGEGAATATRPAVATAEPAAEPAALGVPSERPSPAPAVASPGNIRNPVRVGINLLWLVPGVVGGTESYTIRLLQHVADRLPDDVHVTLFVNTLFSDAHPDVVARFPTVVAPISGRTKPLRLLAETTWLPYQLLRRRIEVAHHAGGLVPAVRVGANVVTVHDLQPLALPSNFTWAKRTYLGWWAPWSARQADRVITLTAWVADDVADRAGVDRGRVHVVTPGSGDTDVESAAELPSAASVRRRFGLDGRPYLLFPAITYPHKNHGMLIEAFAGVLTVHPEVCLVLVGGVGSSEDLVRRRIDELGLARSVLRTGRVADDDLRVLFDEAVAVVFPSLYEGCGIPVLEAMAHHRPVIASTAGGVPETAGTGALLVDPLDTGAWTAAMTDVVEHPASRAALVARGDAWVRQRPDWNASADVQLDVYREVAGA